MVQTLLSGYHTGEPRRIARATNCISMNSMTAVATHVSMPKSFRAFTFSDFLMVLAAVMLIAAIALPMLANAQSRQRQTLCTGNLQQITRALLAYGEESGKLPDRLAEGESRRPLWWFYKELVKGELGLRTPSSPADKAFACPSDRGYEEGKPFRVSAKSDYNSYVFNGVNLSGFPNIAGRSAASINEPVRTLLVMEWTAHAPLSWHRSKTGSNNE